MCDTRLVEERGRSSSPSLLFERRCSSIQWCVRSTSCRTLCLICLIHLVHLADAIRWQVTTRPVRISNRSRNNCKSSTSDWQRWRADWRFSKRFNKFSQQVSSTSSLFIQLGKQAYVCVTASRHIVVSSVKKKKTELMISTELHQRKITVAERLTVPHKRITKAHLVSTPALFLTTYFISCMHNSSLWWRNKLWNGRAGLVGNGQRCVVPSPERYRNGTDGAK